MHLPPPITSKINKAILTEILNSKESTFLHIRRGDYLGANWELGITYYKRALKELLKRVQNPSIFVFCMDKDFARNFDIGYPVKIVQSDYSLPYEDMILMMHCKHGIIANSTYSWWAAYLMSNPHKLIFAPNPWIHSIPGSENIICKSWIKINSQDQ